MHNLKKYFILTALAGMVCVTIPASAANGPVGEDLDTLIQQQQQILFNLSEKKKNEEIINHISTLQEQIKEMREQSNNYDTKGAIEALAGQIATLHEQLQEQIEMFKKYTELTNQRFDELDKNNPYVNTETQYYESDPKKFLVNPGQSEQLNYTQDAVNAQGNSTMTFSYAPNQLYKVYCRVGYLTDLELKKGEKINFVGGGDTSAWAINSTEVDGTPHLYIKPTVASSTTNIIVTTDKRSYQMILTTSDWYNPMVRWTYEGEERIANMMQRKQDEMVITSTFQISSYDNLNFDYEITGLSKYAPSMVFDDGNQTIIKFKKISQNAPALFIRESGKKSISLVNYKIKDNCYIIDRIITEAELRISDKEMIRIKRK